MDDRDAVDLEINIRSAAPPMGAAGDVSAIGYRLSAMFAADATLRRPASQADSALATDVPAPIDPAALLEYALDPAAYGRALTAQLFADQRLREAWQQARALADGANLPLRLRLAVRAPLVGALRWETLRDPATDAPLATDARLRLVRYLDSPDTRLIALGPRPALSALLVVAAPSDLSRYGMAEIDAEGEVGRVRAALSDIALTIVGDHPAASERRATLGAIQRELSRARPTILCLICHGQPTDNDTTLWLEDDTGKTSRTPGSALAQLLAQLDRPPLLALLIACDSAGPLATLGPRLALSGVGAVLAMQAKLTMAAAKLLLPALFSELAHDGRIDRAVSVARAALREGDEWWTPALWLRVRDGRLWTETQLATDPLTLLNALPLDSIPDPAALPPGSRMPFSRNPLFVGRADDLRWLAATLKGGATAAIGQVAATTGLGGIGKTNLATEWVHRYGQFFAGGVFWLSFADPAGVPGEIAACGAALDISGFADLKLDEQVQRVQAAWQQPIPRLLIFDNCDEAAPGQAEELIRTWKPPTGGCRVLITSRRASWSKSLGVTALPLGVLSRAESIALLRKHRPDLAEDDPALDAIAEELGDLPLALHLAGSFLETYHDSPTFGDPADFLAELRDQRLLDHDALKGIDVTPSPTNHELHVARTFALSYSCLDANDPSDILAIQLLARAACLAPGEPIPRDLLLATLGIAEDDRSAQRQAEKGLQELVVVGLIERESAGMLHLHRLLGAFVLRVAADCSAQGAVEQVLRNTMNARRDVSGWLSPLNDILPHLRWVVEQALERADVAAANLANNVAYYYDQIGDYGTACPLYERALQIREQAFGSAHPQTAISLNNLAHMMQRMGHYDEARLLYERALQIHKQTLGPDHLETASTQNNLASLLREMGEYTAARSLCEHALQIRQQTLGPDHLDTTISLNSLAGLLMEMGEFATARPLYERVLQIREDTLGPTHPDTASSLNNLATVLAKMGDFIAARPLYEQALAVTEQMLGSTHPETALSLCNLASVYCEIGNLSSARLLAEQALRIREQILGPLHPDTTMSLRRLAYILRETGDYLTARSLLAQAIENLEQTFGPTHHAVATSLSDLAMILQDIGDHTAALPLAERALHICEQSLGSTHPDTLTSLSNLANLRDSLGDHTGAHTLYERALQICEQIFGSTHLDTAKVLHNLAANCYYRGETVAAVDLMRRALSIREQRLGLDHADTQLSRQNLVKIKQQLENNPQTAPEEKSRSPISPPKPRMP
jgi:tetratricopeptide (TPR) repeat protein